MFLILCHSISFLFIFDFYLFVKDVLVCSYHGAQLEVDTGSPPCGRQMARSCLRKCAWLLQGSPRGDDATVEFDSVVWFCSGLLHSPFLTGTWSGWSHVVHEVLGDSHHFE